MGIETIYANILQSILRIAGKYIVSCYSNVIVIQFSNKNVMILFGDQKIFHKQNVHCLVAVLFCQLNELKHGMLNIFV